jgi:uncharacterized protein YndB with AHSA1/START domain
MANLLATASELIDAPRASVWHALVTPSVIKQYMFDTNVVSDWKEGGPIVWKGEWQGKSYEDKGTILHTVTVELPEEGSRTRVRLTQDNNPSEQAREHSEKNWHMMLTALKQLLERSAHG